MVSVVPVPAGLPPSCPGHPRCPPVAPLRPDGSPVSRPGGPPLTPTPLPSHGDGDGQSCGGGGSVGFTGTQRCYMSAGRAPVPATLRWVRAAAPGSHGHASPGPLALSGSMPPSAGLRSAWSRVRSLVPLRPRPAASVLRPGPLGRVAGSGSSAAGEQPASACHRVHMSPGVSSPPPGAGAALRALGAARWAGRRPGVPAAAPGR